MSDLQPVTIEYDGKTYKVGKDDSIWGLIESVESVITFFELAAAFKDESYPTARIFRAYAAAINYAGGSVTANELRKGSSYKDLGMYAGVLAAILGMAQPGENIDLGEASDAQPQEGDDKKKHKASSARSTKRGSGSGSAR